MTISNLGNGKKIILLILFIIALCGAGILLIDFVSSMFGLYFPIPGLKEIKSFSLKKKIKESEDPYLLEREELGKNKERLILKEEEINVKEKEVQAKEMEAAKKIELIKEKEKELVKKEEMVSFKETQFNNKKINLREQAIKIYNMPPKDAVVILAEQEEASIVDILREIDTYSIEIGRNSISPYLLKLLGDINKEKAANVLRKFQYSNQNKDSSVEMLDENDIEKITP